MSDFTKARRERDQRLRALSQKPDPTEPHSYQQSDSRSESFEQPDPDALKELLKLIPPDQT